MAHVFKRGKIWYIRYKDESNLWQYKSCGKDAKRTDADYLAREYSAKELNRHHECPVRILSTNLEQALIQFRDTVIPRSSTGIEKQESSIRREKSSVTNIITFVQKEKLLHFKSFDKRSALLFMDSRRAEGMQPKTLREDRRLLRKFFKWALKQHYCGVDPTEEIIVPKPTKNNPRFFSKEELRNIFKMAQEPYCSIFKFLFLTGLRAGELCNLEWRDYNREECILTIRIVAADKKNRTPGNKTKREATIPLSKDALTILDQRKAAGDSDRFIFLNHAGNRLDDDNLYRNLMPVLEKAHINGACVHTFRHTFASHLVIAGVSIYIVRDLLRHASVQETEIYAHLSKDSTKTAVGLLSIAKLNDNMDGQRVPSIQDAVNTLSSLTDNTGQHTFAA
jgi:site-specific recombinase XerD